MTGGAPRSRSRHQESSFWWSAPGSDSVWNPEKSANWIGSGARFAARPSRERVVKTRQLLREDRYRPAIEDDVVERDEKDMLLR